jgi:hypothetical protein
MFCKNCKRECEPKTVDFGIGVYEYAGAMGCHSDFHEVSPCCEAECVDELDPEDEEDNEVYAEDVVS